MKLTQKIYILSITILITITACKNRNPIGVIPVSKAEYDSFYLADLLPSNEKAIIRTSIDLSSQMPPPGDQGKKGSCVAFTVAYDVISYEERRAGSYSYCLQNGTPDSTKIYSPAFIYNGVKSIYGDDDCSNGIKFTNALQYVMRNGICSLEDFPYSGKSTQCEAPANTSLLKKAMQKRYYRFHSVDLDKEKIKNCLTCGYPVMAAIFTSQNFDIEGFAHYKNYHDQLFVWEPDVNDIDDQHAMTIVGYDDTQGLFKLMNSYGKNWGNDGYCYVSYSNLLNRTTELYYAYESSQTESLHEKSFNIDTVRQNANYSKIRIVLQHTIDAMKKNERRTSKQNHLLEELSKSLTSFN